MTTTPTPDAAKTAGQVAYEAYCNHTGWKSLASGHPLPQWGQQRKEISDTWDVAAKAAIDHWRRNVVVTESVRNEVVETIHSRISHIYGTYNLDYGDIADAAIKAALGAGK